MAHVHRKKSESLCGYQYPVGYTDHPKRPGQTPVNPVAHGGTSYRVDCSCGAYRLENHNAGQVESSGWIEPEGPQIP